MFTTAYTTSPLAGYGMTTERTAIKQEWLLNGSRGMIRPLHAEHHENGIGLNGDKDKRYVAKVLVDGNANIPLFAHPLDVEVEPGLIFTIIDCRGLVSVGYEGDVRVKAHMEYEFNATRAALSSEWLKNCESEFSAVGNGGDFPALIFSRWIAETVSRRFGLETDSQLRLQVLAAHHFMSMHCDNTKPLTEKERVYMQMKITRVTRLPASVVTDVLSDLEWNKDIKDFINNIKELSQSARLEDFTEFALITILKNSWFGKNASEILAMSLEFPPVFNAIVYSALSESGYNKTNIGQLAKQEAKSQSAAAYLTEISHTLKKG